MVFQMGMELYRAQSSSPLGEDTLKGWRVGIDKYLFRIPCVSDGKRIAASGFAFPTMTANDGIECRGLISLIIIFTLSFGTFL